MSVFVSAVIVAAGGSVRMGIEDSKQFIPLLSRPAIEYTLRAFEECRKINEIVVVCREQDSQRISELADENGFKKVTAIVQGGSSRHESVKNGVGAVDGRAKIVAIHDGARPLVLVEDIERVVEAAVEMGAATLGTSVTDTIKVVDGFGMISETPVRAQLRAVQTPQAFDKELYCFALDNAKGESADFTDDCALIEKMGGEVKVIKGSRENIKLTRPIDIVIAESILRARKQASE